LLDPMPVALRAFCEASTPRAGRRLLKTLARATLIFPTAPQSEGQPPSLAFTSNAAGQPVLPAFTDEPYVLQWLPEGSDVVTAAASGFAPALLSGAFVGLVINPASETGVFVGRRLIELLVEGRLRSVSDADLEVLRPWQQRQPTSARS